MLDLARWILANSLNFLRTFLFAAASIVLIAPMAFAQGTVSASAPPTPSFDVATIKPIPPGGRPTQGWVGMQIHPDGMAFAFQSLPDLLCYAYGYKNLRFDGQVTGLSDWALTQRYDVVAKIIAADMPAFQRLSKDEQEQWRQATVRSLLAQRFALTLHRGAKQIPVYELVVAKGGTKMKDAATDPAPPPLGLGDDGKPRTGIRWGKDTSIVQAYSMQSLTDLLSMPAAQVGRPVLDKTALTGTYNFTLDWSIYSASAAATNDATTIFTALGELGLKLQPSTASFDTIVVDHVERPTPD
jgi:bla regulator protein blaR1